ncbi:MAG: zinc ribbon domain-containing protein [Lachnospiraceae bacterium]|jgi:hypothetical protein|nr:zinc ribbon domain-containing protein [Lachnospiraceae bacterium]
MEESRVCPKCGMQLVGKNNYCMGCGKNIELSAEEETAADVGFARENNRGFGNRYLNPEYIAREKAARQKRRQKKNIFDESGLSFLLLLALGLFLGVGIGAYLLSLYFAPKDGVVVLQKKTPVTELAGVDYIDPPEDPFAAAFWEAVEQQNSDGEKKSSKDSKKQAEQQKPRDQKTYEFHGEMTIFSKGDQVLSWEEEQVWRYADADRNSVANVVNHLEQQGAPYLFSVFIDWNVTQDDQSVVLRRGVHQLDLKDNLVEAVSKGLIDREAVVSVRGKNYVSLKKLLEILDLEAWEVKEVPAEEASTGEEAAEGS